VKKDDRPQHLPLPHPGEDRARRDLSRRLKKFAGGIMIGTQISHYRILQKIGAGGMGEVYLAEDIKLDRKVALKFLPAQFSADEEERKRFIHEAKAASALDHANICSVYEIGETPEGQLFIAMGYYAGKTLKELITVGARRAVPLPINDVIKIVMQIAEGLRKAHDKGIVHRDLKPANVMLTEEGTVKIVDFGLAKLKGMSRLTRSGTTLGTVAYMSPEQALGKEADQRSDIWSLGVILYEMLTGKLPFPGEYEQGIIYAILNENLPTGSLERIGVPPTLTKIIAHCLEKKPDKRYQQADEIISDLQTMQQKAKGTIQRKKQKLRLTLLIAAAVIFLSALILSYRFLLKKPITIREKSIAVLPFVDMSPQKDQDYFCDGMTEELINRLSNVRELKVPARTSAFVFKGKTQNIIEIGKKLSVQTVLEGSVQKSGDRLRITAQLIKIADGFHLWSAKYDCKLEDVFAIQDEISQAIVGALKIELSVDQHTQLTKHHTENTEAYQLYLRGRFHFNKRTNEGLRKSVECFEKAIENDPHFALSYAGLADSWMVLGMYFFSQPIEAFERANAAAVRALKIDNTLSEAHTSLAYVRMSAYWDWPGAESEFKSAMDLNPGNPITHHVYSSFLVVMGRIHEAIKEAKRALELDPLSLINNEDLGDVLGLARRYDEAIEQLLKTLDLDPSFRIAYLSLFRAYRHSGKDDKAVAAFLKVPTPGQMLTPDQVATVQEEYRKSGMKGFLKKRLEFNLEWFNRKYVSSWNIAWCYADLGEKDKAFEWLEKAYAERSIRLSYLRADASFDFMRSDPRYSQLLKNAGIVE
jgi:serine/threonine protein kinase